MPSTLADAAARTAAVRAAQHAIQSHFEDQAAAGRPPLTWAAAAAAVDAAMPHLRPPSRPAPPPPPRPRMGRALLRHGAVTVVGAVAIGISARLLWPTTITWVDVATVAGPFVAAVAIMTLSTYVRVNIAYDTGYLDATSRVPSAHATMEEQVKGLLPAPDPAPVPPVTWPAARNRPGAGGSVVLPADDSNSGPGRGTL